MKPSIVTEMRQFITPSEHAQRRTDGLCDAFVVASQGITRALRLPMPDAVRRELKRTLDAMHMAAD